jgi:hypothetical protein
METDDVAPLNVSIYWGCCTPQRFHILVMLHPSTFPYTGDVAPLNVSIYWWVLLYRYFTNLFLYKNMTVVLLLHPKINCMTIPPVVPVKNCRTILYRKHFVVSIQIVHLDREKCLSPWSDNHWTGYRYFGKCFYYPSPFTDVWQWYVLHIYKTYTSRVTTEWRCWSCLTYLHEHFVPLLKNWKEELGTIIFCI